MVSVKSGTEATAGRLIAQRILLPPLVRSIITSHFIGALTASRTVVSSSLHNFSSSGRRIDTLAEPPTS